MGSKQWGHGYHKGLKEALKSNAGLVGLWVHILDKDGKIVNQLEVVKELPGDRFLLQYYSFLDGLPTNCKIFTIEQMEEFVFYPNARAMRYAFHKKNPGKDSFEQKEAFLEALQSC